MDPFTTLILAVLDIYSWILIATIVLSWLVAFNVVNSRNNVVRTIGEVLYRLTEPVLRPIRNLLPNMGGLDLSPIVVFLGIWFLQMLIVRYMAPAMVGAGF
ncbi:YggT family protein [Zavarzinia sp. CC-PAN008]|uniref:YggT family protein n=1 Tax=Zavarzinia sp. CC-PAN008 TaxID=3243332 RepID=UPI003F74A401